MAETETKTTYNDDIITILNDLSIIMKRRKEIFRLRAYDLAKEEIIKYTKSKGNITSIDQIKDLPNIGKTILEKIQEFIKTGTLKLLEEERKNPEHIQYLQCKMLKKKNF